MIWNRNHSASTANERPAGIDVLVEKPKQPETGNVCTCMNSGSTGELRDFKKSSESITHQNSKKAAFVSAQASSVGKLARRKQQNKELQSVMNVFHLSPADSFRFFKHFGNSYSRYAVPFFRYQGLSRRLAG
jgi:hypothetical protein